ncbi:MAG TPA: hypothetical protein VLX28_18065 [Thermoanaerobaculia bacterium]|nr:hypothetical protein [Thermoanaerobaculia bacterium]
MSKSEDYRRDIAGRFSQAMRAKVFELTYRWFPEIAEQVIDQVDREVEEQGLQLEGIEVIRRWFRSDADADWLDQFWQSPEGNRFLELSLELVTRSMYRQFLPEVPIPPPGES